MWLGGGISQGLVATQLCKECCMLVCYNGPPQTLNGGNDRPLLARAQAQVHALQQNGVRDTNETVGHASSAANRGGHSGGLAKVLTSSLYSASGVPFEASKHLAGDPVR